MDPRSDGNLATCEPDLRNVIRAASQKPQGFVVTYGIRTKAAEAKAVATGHSQTMHSRHLADKAGYSAAVDVTPCDAEGRVYFPSNADTPAVYGEIAKQIKAAAEVLHVPIEWGGDWAGPGKGWDWGHFQLPWSEYP